MSGQIFFHHESYQIDGVQLGIAAVWHDRTLLSLSLSPDRLVAIERCLVGHGLTRYCFAPFPRQLAKEFQQALDGKRVTWSWQAQPRCGTAFQKRIWKTLEGIEAGQTISYSELARKVGSPRAARAVGSACSRNPLPLRIPCHRVVATNGNLGGFTGDLRVKECLLAREAMANQLQGSLYP